MVAALTGSGLAEAGRSYTIGPGEFLNLRQLVLARIIEPASRLDSLRVLAETGVEAVSYRTLKRRLPGYAREAREGLAAQARGRLRAARRAGTGVAGALRRVHALLRDRPRRRVREPGFSKERRLEPQITIGLLTDASGSR